MLSFKPALSLFSFTFKGLFSSSSLSAIRVVSSVYLRLLIFLLIILIPGCESSNLTFHMMHFAYKLNKQGDNMQPYHTPFPILNQFIVLCLVLTVSFWSAYRLLRKQVRWSCIPISLRIFQFVVIYTVKGFSVVNEAKWMFFWNSFVFSMIQWILAIWSLVPLPFLNPACTSGSSQFAYYWCPAWRILSITLLACEMSTTVT